MNPNEIERGINRMRIKLDDGAFMPVRAHSTDAGLDIKTPRNIQIHPSGSAVVHTGVHIELPVGTAGIIMSKSGLNVKHDITATGLIDEGYTGEIVIKLYNHGKYECYLSSGDKIAQLVVLPVVIPEITLTDSLTETERGNNGFGSSGK